MRSTCKHDRFWAGSGHLFAREARWSVEHPDGRREEGPYAVDWLSPREADAELVADVLNLLEEHGWSIQPPGWLHSGHQQ